MLNTIALFLNYQSFTDITVAQSEFRHMILILENLKFLLDEHIHMALLLKAFGPVKRSNQTSFVLQLAKIRMPSLVTLVL